VARVRILGFAVDFDIMDLVVIDLDNSECDVVGMAGPSRAVRVPEKIARAEHGERHDPPSN
jgi:hypothetical protein